MDLGAEELFGNLESAGLRRSPVRSVLAVDDSRTNLNVLGRRLAQLGYMTVLSDNGPDALDLIAARIDRVLGRARRIAELKRCAGCADRGTGDGAR